MALVVGIVGGTATPARPTTPPPIASSPEAVPTGAEDHILVSFGPSVPPAERDRLVAGVAAGPLEPIGLRSYRLPVAPGAATQAVESLRGASPDLTAELDYEMAATAAPDDYYYDEQWGLSNTGQYDYALETFGRPGVDIDAEAAWSVTTGSDQVVVGVIDTGITLSHPDLVDNLWLNPGGIGNCPAGTRGYDSVSGDCTPADVEMHGTHVAGIIGAQGNNGLGVSGVAWDVKLMGLRAMGASGASTSDLVEAIHWAVEAKRAGVNVRVLNASLGGTHFSGALYDEIAWAGVNDILFVTAAGNGGDDGVGDDIDLAPQYPCAYELVTVVCVANSTSRDRLAESSNFGAVHVDLAAPGTDIVSTVPTWYPPVNNGGYWGESGTSMAAPFVAGAAALALSQGYLSAPALKQRLLDGVEPVPGMGGFVATGGRLNLCRVISGCSLPTLAPFNDDFDSAYEFTGAGGRQGESAFATRQAGEPGHGDATVWFSFWNSGATTTVDAATDSPARILVYTGSSVDSLTLVGASAVGTDLRVNIPGADGMSGTYRIVLASASGAGGPYTLSVQSTPAGYEPLPKQPWSPDTVTGVTAQPGDGSAQVTWEKPDGHRSPISAYTVRVYRNGLTTGDIAVTADETRLVVSGLTNGVTYSFRVAATNTVGTGYLSALSPRVVPTAPSAVDPPPVDPGLGPAGPPAPPARPPAGYWMVGADGAVYSFGDAPWFGNAAVGSTLAVDIEPTTSGNGYWIVDALGRVHPFGDAVHHGDVDRAKLAAGERITGLSATRSGNGYWVFTSKGRALTFGDAVFLGDVSALTLNGPVLDSIGTPSGNGYYMVASDGGVFSFGDAKYYGSMGGHPLNAPVQSLVPDGDRVGYWLVASDGGIFAFDADFKGSMGAARLNRPVTGMVPAGSGYLMVGEDGGIFDFSGTSDGFKGSLGANPPARPITAVAVFDPPQTILPGLRIPAGSRAPLTAA